MELLRRLGLVEDIRRLGMPDPLNIPSNDGIQIGSLTVFARKGFPIKVLIGF